MSLFSEWEKRRAPLIFHREKLTISDIELAEILSRRIAFYSSRISPNKMNNVFESQQTVNPLRATPVALRRTAVIFTYIAWKLPWIFNKNVYTRKKEILTTRLEFVLAPLAVLLIVANPQRGYALSLGTSEHSIWTRFWKKNRKNTYYIVIFDIIQQ
jgi:hypothetical protein